MRIRTRTGIHLGRKGTFFLCLLLGIALLLAGIGLLSRTNRIINNGISVEAQVTNVKVSRSGKNTYYTPEIRFATSEGKTVNTTLNKTTGSPAYSVGDKVRIIYSKDNPNDILVDSFFNKYGFPVIFIMAGFIVLIVGFLQVFRR
ncbi:MAG: DUF3592 domain-containing protein [Bacillota bacterium]